MPKLELKTCLKDLNNLLNEPTAAIFTLDKNKDFLTDIFDFYKWHYVVFVLDDKPNKDVAFLSSLMVKIGLVVIDIESEFNSGVMLGFSVNKVPSLIINFNRREYGILQKLATSTCFCNDDLLLFLDSFNERKYLSEITTRINTSLMVVRQAREGY